MRIFPWYRLLFGGDQTVILYEVQKEPMSTLRGRSFWFGGVRNKKAPRTPSLKHGSWPSRAGPIQPIESHNPAGSFPFRPRLDATSRLDQKFKPSDKLVESLLLFMNNKVIHSSVDQSDKLFKEKLRLRTNKAYPSSSLEHELKGIRVTISWTIFWLKSF